jgi:phosphoribosyl 1,2-cyclic phosphodiesterase
MDRIKFLGTGGARFVVTRQLRKTGGIWLSLDDTDVLIDPGPGCLVNCLNSRPKLKPTDLDGIVLTHRHIDHCNDVNIMIEAMTNGGNKKRGMVFAPSDALDEDPVILEHFRNHVESLKILKEKESYNLGNISFTTPVKHVHGVETYGLNLYGEKNSVSIVSDTKYFDDLESYYDGDILVLYVVLRDSKEEVLHLSFDDVERIVEKIDPRLCILTHFGMNAIRAKPWVFAEKVSKKLGIDVVAASDGRNFEL